MLAMIRRAAPAGAALPVFLAQWARVRTVCRFPGRSGMVPGGGIPRRWGSVGGVFPADSGG